MSQSNPDVSSVPATRLSADPATDPWGSPSAPCRGSCRRAARGSGQACRECHFVTMADGSRLSPGSYVAFCRSTAAMTASAERCTAARHEALKHDAAAWSALQVVGEQRLAADQHGPEIHLELRNCTCGSTLAINLTSAR